MKYIYSVLLFSIFIGSSLTSMAQPANDLCSNAAPITDLDGTCNSFSNVGATATNPYIPPCFGNTNIVWFSFVADGPNADFTVSGINRPEIGIIGLNQTGGTDLCDIADVLSYGCSNPTGNYSSLTISINNNSLIPGETYLIAVANNTGGGGGPGTFDLCVDNPVNTSPSTCANAAPFCTADGDVVFDAGVDDGIAEPGNNYGCLITRPNPAWFFLEIDTGGDIDLSLTSSPAEDIDFVAYGPFTDLSTACSNLTAGNIQDCSFAALTAETVDINGTAPGEVYLVMITNFSNNPTEITFSQTGGTAATDCAIVLPVTLSSFGVETFNNSNELFWTTASELNNDYFILEHSTDGKSWNDLEKIQGAGTSNSENTYLTYHRDFQNKINYYRLKQVDFDGTSINNKIISIDNRVGKVLLKRVNLMGQQVHEDYSGLVIEYYKDGNTRKVIQ